MSEEQACLVKLLRTLNSKTPEELLEQMALRLQLTARLGAFGDQNSARNAGPAAARRELDKAALKAADLARQMQSLHADSLRAVEDTMRGFEKVESRAVVAPFLHPFALADALLGFALAASHAMDRVIATAPYKSNRHKAQARRVTHLARTLYEQLTGNKASRATDAYKDGQSVSPFTDFLCQVFSILKVKAKADSQAKLLLQSSPVELKPSK